jgi:hypothetical protein
MDVDEASAQQLSSAPPQTQNLMLFLGAASILVD